MSHIRRGSVSSTRSESPMVFVTASNAETDEWIKLWSSVTARSLIHSQVIAVDADTSVEDACETLLSQDSYCLAVKSDDGSYVGLFDHSDVNAFLVLAATRHRSLRDDDRDDPRAERIIAAATAGHVPVHLVSNLSDKNPLEVLSYDANLISLLAVFARGTHRVLIRGPSLTTEFLGIVSDSDALSWFSSQAQKDAGLMRYLSNPLNCLPLPSLYLYSSVVSVSSTSSTLDAMTLMSDEGVSSVAVIDEDQGHLISAVSVTDIGKIVVPSENSQILSTPVLHLVARIKDAIGDTDGADRFPVYSVVPSNNLIYAVQKLLATNSHRLFITDDCPNSPSPTNSPYSLSGIISTVDILSLFAVLANIPDVDPTRMQRHRRASSSSTTSSSSPSSSPHEFFRSRSSSRTSGGRSSADLRGSISLESFQRK